MTAWRQNVTFQRYQLKNAMHNGCSAESFSHCVPFSEYEQEMGKREKSPPERRSRPPPFGFTRAPRLHTPSAARAAGAAAPSSAARPQRRLSLSLEAEAVEHDRVRGRQAEGRTNRGRSSAPTPLHYILCLWHGSALIRCGSLLTNCSGTLPACTE